MGDSRLDHERRYREHVRNLDEMHGDHAIAMEQAVGGAFETVGQMEVDLVMSIGLPADGYLIDVGCGSGRLATPLSKSWKGNYLGTDVVPELLEHARQIVETPEWNFTLCSDFVIPASDNVADMVCFFSVFTHLLHEEIFRYLREAHRVLRSGGRVVFSFLEFSVRSHWSVFATDVDAGGTVHHNQFISRDGIEAWADHLNFEVESVWAGDVPFIPLSKPVAFAGHVMEGIGTFGQSAAVLQK